ncbi:MAG: DUF2516 family protein [Candidatus Nanopelagicales bacterium]|nr:DUF2516 family protein [Candidatus Nanopelagicales bacterium]MCF8539056.1 DUF2516 family protein [Candidatus Nanopelagicales bacterium]MCF8550527.1 DUF2516 family protein [Candidatus Nanopelagicales bacterium]
MGLDGLVVLVLWAILLAVKAFALVDCVRRPADYFPYLGRQTKMLWVALTAVSLVAGLAPNLTMSIFGIAGTIVSLIYLLDIRPKMIEITGKKF